MPLDMANQGKPLSDTPKFSMSADTQPLAINHAVMTTILLFKA